MGPLFWSRGQRRPVRAHVNVSMKHKCIMVKIKRKLKSKLSKKNLSLAEIVGIYKFCGNRGICNMHEWLRGVDTWSRVYSRPKGTIRDRAADSASISHSCLERQCRCSLSLN